ncbi:MAG: AMP-binding protein [Bacteroidales bacterium]|nr:AMP-binding protein [Bacteroidales bacterium]
MKYKTEREFHKNFLLKEGDYRSIREMLGRINRMIPQKVLLAELDAGNNMVEYTAQNIYNEVMALGEGLVAEGLKGAHIAIVSENCCRYVIADISISSGVGVVVPVDVNSPDNLMATLLQKSDADAVLCGADLVELMEQMQQCCPRLKKIITLDRKVAGYPSYEEIVGKGKTLDGEYRNVELDLDAPAKILFTSGTTGANKGVVLTNANLAANMVNCMDSIMTAGDTTSMSVLPMHHATEINTHIMTRIGSGRLTYVNGNMRNLMKNMKVFKPHLITVVPMIANAFYRNIQAGVKKAGMEEKLQKGIKLSNMLRKIGIDRTHKMFADLFVPFGGNLNMIVCGGSMLNPVVIKGMNDLGVRMENGYGITECGPLISINGDTLSEHLSVGKPCPGLQVKIASPDADGIGDLCVKGKSVFKEYYKDPEATAAVFDEEGFFNTGDSARIDSKGRIFLVGRKKNTIVLENGKNVCPEEIENVIETNMGYADEIAVYQAELKVGNVSRSVICAGIFIKDEQERGNRRAIEADMERINALLPDYKRIEYVELPLSEYRKTSSKKIIRKNLPQNCSGEGILLM